MPPLPSCTGEVWSGHESSIHPSFPPYTTARAKPVTAPLLIFRCPAAPQGETSEALKLIQPRYSDQAQPLQSPELFTDTAYGPPPAPAFAELKLIQPKVSDQAQPLRLAAWAEAAPKLTNRVTKRTPRSFLLCTILDNRISGLFYPGNMLSANPKWG